MHISTTLKKFVLATMLALTLVAGFASTTTVRAQGLTNEELLAIILELTEVLAALQAQIAAGTVTPPATPPPFEVFDYFTAPVVSGETNGSIELLQRVLATDPAVYPEGTVTGFFGALTTSAISRFQASLGLPVSGTFTAATETVLNEALSRFPLEENPTDYLRLAGIREVLNTTANQFVLDDVVVGGKVVLRTPPQFTVSAKSTDVATIQRILGSDTRIYRSQAVTGFFDIPTQEAVISFRARYGIPYTRDPGDAIDPAELMNAETVQAFRTLLVTNDSDTVKSDLLLLPAAAPTAVITGAQRDISVVEATRDYRADNTRVLVRYVGRVVERFEIDTTEPNTAVINAIATYLDRPATDFNTKMKYLEMNGRDLKDILFTIKLSDEMFIDVEYMDRSREYFDIGPAEIDSFVLKTYGGNYEQYEADFIMYRDRARAGEDISEINEIVAEFIGATEEEVAAVIRIEVEEPEYDPCASGCGG